MEYKNPGKLNFKAKIMHFDGGGSFVEFPFNVEEKFGVKGRVPVKATFDGEPYRGSLAKMGPGKHMIGVLKEIQAKINKFGGDTIAVEIELDDKPRVVDVPNDLASALKQNPPAQEFFKKLSYSHQREYVNYINEAKKEETRLRRIDKTIEMLEQQLKLKS